MRVGGNIHRMVFVAFAVMLFYVFKYAAIWPWLLYKRLRHGSTSNRVSKRKRLAHQQRIDAMLAPYRWRQAQLDTLAALDRIRT